MVRVRTAVAVLLVAAVFGIVTAAFKGDNPGLRSAIGNLSAPWLLVAFLPATLFGRLLVGVLMGLVSTLVALAGFYVTLTVVLAGHLGGGGPVREFFVEAGANRIYFVAGLVTGPLFGALGAYVGRRHRSVLAFVVGGLLAGEIAAAALLRGHQLAPPPFYFSWAVDDWRPYIAECLLGLGIVVVGLIHQRPVGSQSE